MINLADREDGAPMSQAMKPAEQNGHEEHELVLNVLLHGANEIARHPGHALDLAKQGAALARSLGRLSR